jgi:hypothetical protein
VCPHDLKSLLSVDFSLVFTRKRIPADLRHGPESGQSLSNDAMLTKRVVKQRTENENNLAASILLRLTI